MAHLKVYQKVLKTASLEELEEEFYRVLIDTNRSYNFFVDWEKVRSNVDRFNVEINILNSLIGSKNIALDFSKLLKKYPEVIEVIPIIIALREKKVKIVEDFTTKDVNIIEYLFEKRNTFSDGEIRKLTHFCQKTGLFNLLSDKKLQNLRDYILGVEVGMDTHARKNRSGEAMELAITPLLKTFERSIEDFQVVAQKRFRYLKEKLKLAPPDSLLDRKFDFLLIHKEKYFNLEADYFKVTGSKPQEIVDAYLNRQKELHSVGWQFIWITDGEGWRGQKNQLRKSLQEMDYVLNLHFIREGMLEEIIKK